MQKKQDKIEEKFKQSLDNFKVDPPESIKKKLFFWLAISNFLVLYRNYFFTGIVVATAGVVMYFSLADNKENEKSKIPSNTYSQVANESFEHDLIKENAPVNPSQNTFVEKREDLPNVIQASPVAQEEEKQNTEVAINTKANNEVGKTVEKTEIQTQATAPSRNKKSSVKNKNKKTQHLNTVTQQDVADKNNSTVPEQVKESSSSKLNSSTFANDFASPSTEKLGFTNSEEEKKMASEEQATNNTDSIQNTAGVDSTFIITKVADSIVTNQKTKKNKGVYLGQLSSYLIWKNKNDSITLSPSVSAGLFVELRKKGANVSLGALFRQQSIAIKSIDLETQKEYSYKPKYRIKKDTIYDAKDTTKTKPKIKTDTTFVGFDTLVKTNTIKHDLTQNINLTYLSFPLHVGWNFYFKKHEIGIQAGAFFSVLANQKSTLAKPVYTPKKMLIHSEIGLRYGYNFSQQLVIILGGSYRNDFSGSIVKKTQKLTGVSGNLALMYKF